MNHKFTMLFLLAIIPLIGYSQEQEITTPFEVDHYVYIDHERVAADYNQLSYDSLLSTDIILNVNHIDRACNTFVTASTGKMEVCVEFVITKTYHYDKRLFGSIKSAIRKWTYNTARIGINGEVRWLVVKSDISGMLNNLDLIVKYHKGFKS